MRGGARQPLPLVVQDEGLRESLDTEKRHKTTGRLANTEQT